MVGRVIAGVVGGGILAAGALVLGYHGYQRYLEWLVAGSTESVNRQPAPGPGDNPPGAGGGN